MALTKVTGQVIKNTTDVTVGVLTVTNTLAVGGTVSIGGTLTYEDVTNVDAVGIITARSTIDAQGDVSIADKIIHTGDTNTAIRFPSADTVSVETGGSESFRVDSSQRLLLGHTSSQTIGSNSHGLSQINVTANQPVLTLSRFENVPAGPSLVLGKSRAGSAGSYTVVQDDDGLGSISFAGADGTDLVTVGANIEAQVDGTPGSNDMPTRLVFATTADGASSPTERLRITQAGVVEIDRGSSADQAVDIKTTAGSGATRLRFMESGTDKAELTYSHDNDLIELIGMSGNGISFITNGYGNERLRITSAGLVGINETPTIAQFQVRSAQLGGTSGNTQEVLRLHSPDVSNTTSYRFTNYRVSDGTSHSSSELRFRRHVDATDMGFFGLGDGYLNFGYGTAEKARITSAGYVGISTITPNAKLHVLANNQAGILIEDDNNNNAAPYLEIIGKRGDGNNHQSFAGQAFLARNRTGDKIEVDQKLGVVLFGGNHTNASKSNIAYPASIAGIATGNFNSVTDMPTALAFYTGFTGRIPTTPNVSSGVERMRISPEGYVTTPYNTAFCARGDQGIFNMPAGQQLQFNNYSTMNGAGWPNSRNSAYNTSTYKYTAPVSGVYSFTVNLYFRNDNLSNICSIVPRINGSEINQGGDIMFFFSVKDISSDNTISGTLQIYLTAGQQFDVARRTGQTGTHSAYMPHSSFSGFLIG